MYGAHSDTWKNAMAALWSWADTHGGVSTIPPGAEVDGQVLSRWVSTRRHEYRTGRLDADQVAQLRALPGWSWGTGHREQWVTTFAVLRAYTVANGTAGVPAGHVVGDVRLGAWVSRQRTAHRRGRLPTARATALRRLPGWVWDRDI